MFVSENAGDGREEALPTQKQKDRNKRDVLNNQRMRAKDKERHTKREKQTHTPRERQRVFN